MFSSRLCQTFLGIGPYAACAFGDVSYGIGTMKSRQNAACVWVGYVQKCLSRPALQLYLKFWGDVYCGKLILAVNGPVWSTCLLCSLVHSAHWYVVVELELLYDRRQSTTFRGVFYTWVGSRPNCALPSDCLWRQQYGFEDEQWDVIDSYLMSCCIALQIFATYLPACAN
jgi:hypothetical protein